MIPETRPRLLDQVRQTCRTRHLSYNTEKSYVNWIKRFVRYCGTKHPLELNVGHIRAFLTYLATKRRVTASTQNQALNAIVFLYEAVDKLDISALHAALLIAAYSSTPHSLLDARLDLSSFSAGLCSGLFQQSFMVLSINPAFLR